MGGHEAIGLVQAALAALLALYCRRVSLRVQGCLTRTARV
jgi:hypothetical protein